jgi:hypothetical protein
LGALAQGREVLGEAGEEPEKILKILPHPRPAMQNPTSAENNPGSASHWTEEAHAEPGVRPSSGPEYHTLGSSCFSFVIGVGAGVREGEQC